jgi:integrase
MRRPNNSGSVFKLSGKRRRPYAVRIYKGVELKNGKATNKYEYLAYFEKQKDALKYLEKYNSSPVTIAKEADSQKKHKFSEIYDMWISELERRTKPLSQQSFYSYQAAYNNLKPLHNMVFENILLEDLEAAALQHSSKSLSTISNIKTVLKGMYKTALRHRYITDDISQLLILEHKDENARPHKPFNDTEIAILWKHTDVFIVRIVLILIYTGMRVNELLLTKSENVYLNDRYLVGGLKTAAGKGRKIPISEKIVSLIDTSNEYLITYEGKKLDYHKACGLLDTAMSDLGMTHQFHDTRHTCSTLMERAKIEMLHRKLILGHKSNDITDHYTHVSIEQLIKDINEI